MEVAHCNGRYFYPRPPRGGRPRSERPRSCGTCISIHALREEGDFRSFRAIYVALISIHALREEGDPEVPGESCGRQISIHALREEGDL